MSVNLRLSREQWARMNALADRMSPLKRGAFYVTLAQGSPIT